MQYLVLVLNGKLWVQIILMQPTCTYMSPKDIESGGLAIQASLIWLKTGLSNHVASLVISW